MIYQWKSKAHIKADAQAVGERLEVLRRENGGFLSREMVLADSAAPESPLHPCFEWDDRAAAHAYRLNQASHVIQSVVVAVERHDETPVVVRAFVHVEVADRPDVSYTSVGDAMADPVLRQQVIQRAWMELEQWRQRYKDYEELATVFSAIESNRVAA